MEFDEYEYLEKTVENNAISAEKEPPANGIRSDDELDQDSARATHARSEENLQLKKSSSRRRSSDDHRSRSSEENGREKRRKEDKERERERDKSRDRDREMEKETERSRRSRSRSERRRDEDRERSRRSSTSERPRDERDRSRRSRSRSDRYRDEVERSRRSRSRSERHREEELERSRRSRSRSERYHGDDYDRHRERSSERELRERESRHAEYARRHKDKKDEAAEPEADPERDQRTVFAYQINLKADERDVYEFFSRAGKVRDVRLIMDRNSRRSKGVGYIEFYDVLSVPMAIALSGQLLLGQPVMIKPSEAEKNLIQSTASAAGGTGPASGVARRLYAGNLPMNITEEQLRLVFEPFGVVELVQLPLDLETRQCKGYGFIQFARLEDARAAQSLNGQLEIAGRTIKVSSVSEHVGMQDAGANTADLDDDEGGLALNAQSRAILMQKLDRSGIVSSVANPLLPTIPTTLPTAAPILGGAAVIPAAPVDPIGPPSECLLLKNMFDPSVETEPDFDLDIKEDVQEECSKFGAIKHIFVDKNSVGFVYLRFDKVASALSAQRALHGRWFAGKMISATFMLPQAYGAKFPGTG